MGRSITSKYAGVATYKDGSKMQFCWKGKTSKKSLLDYLNVFNESVLRPDGCNHHLFKELGKNAIAVSLEVKHNYNGGEIVNKIEVPFEETVKIISEKYRNSIC